MTSFVTDPRSLTKEKLKSQLSKNRIPLPSKDSRKDVYVELYRTHLSPRKSVHSAGAAGGGGAEHLNSFSSDEEDSFGDSSPRRKRKPGSVGQANMVVTQNTDVTMVTDVTKLSDGQLFSALKEMGVSVGPIQDTTRAVYQRKLHDLLTKVVEDKEDIRQEEEVDDEEDYSDQDDTQILDEKDVAELETNNMRRRNAPVQVTTQRTVKVTNIVNNQGSKTDQVETEKMTTKKADGKVEVDTTVTTMSSVDGKVVKNTSVSTKKKGMSLWVQVCILAAVALVIFIVIATMEPSSSNPVSGKIN